MAVTDPDDPTPPAAAAHPHAPHDTRVRRVELLISTLLRIGVVGSLAVVLLGTVISFVHHPDYFTSHKALAKLTRPGAAFPRSVADVAAEVRQFHGQAIVVVGLILLIATPVVRVAVSVLAFVYQRDRAFVAITAVVLGLLLLSFVLGKAET
jgi:uncharacterized membrane protein